MSSATTRRQFVKSAAQGTAAAACGGFIWHALLAQQAAAAMPLRPPAAARERDFIATCIKCGLCLQACPYQTLKLARTSTAVVAGTPYFVPRDVPCFMCPDIPCAKACPTGALDAKFSDIARARMGLAVIDPESCLSWQGLRCEICFRVCPVKGKAITIANHPRQVSKHAMFVPVVHGDACTGCGVCEKRCPTDVAAIRIVDPQLVQGKIGAHYRLSGAGPAPATPEVSAAPPAGPRTSATPPPPPPSPPTPTPTTAPKSSPLDYLNRGGTP